MTSVIQTEMWFHSLVLFLCCLTVLGSHPGSNFPDQHHSVNDAFNHLLSKEKCMDELGCFNNGPPFFDIWQRPVSLLPDDREDINTTFTLHTRQIPTSQLFTMRKQKAPSLVDFQSSRRTIFIVPGFMSDYAPAWVKDLAANILKANDSNVFTVSWTGGDGPIYEQAVSNTRVVAAEIAMLISFLQREFSVKAEFIYIVGHSLGAHIAGYVGQRIKGIGRITGLDPAGPYFEKVDQMVRLDSSDATLVDCIHTDKANSRFQGFGTTESICDMDFFPNGGQSQPGCPPKLEAAWEFIIHSLNQSDFYRIMCDHQRSIELFMNSIQNPNCPLFSAVCDSWEKFNSGRCQSCSHGPNAFCLPFGFHMESYLPEHPLPHLDLYLNTTDTSPFCIHQ